MLKYLIAIGLPLTVFSKEIGMLEIGGVQLDLIAYPLFVIVFAYNILNGRIRFQKVDLLFGSWLLFGGICGMLFFGNSGANFLKQLIPVFLIFSSIRSSINVENIEEIFSVYFKFAIVAALIGFVQLILKSVFGYLFLTNLSALALDSVALEPSHYVAIVLPALIYKIEKKEFDICFWIVAASVAFTFKLTAFLSILLYFVVTSRKFGRLAASISIACLLFYLFVDLQSEQFDRIASLLKYLQDGDLYEMQNLTTLSFVSHFNVAMESLKSTFGMGVGLGGHPVVYNKVFPVNMFTLNSAFGLNIQSAHSLVIRIISELGIPGISMLLAVVYRVGKLPRQGACLIAYASLSHFAVKSIKLGGYFDYGTMFFLILILVIIEANDKRSQNSEAV